MAYFIRLVRFTPEGLKEMKQFKEKRAKFHAQTKELGFQWAHPIFHCRLKPRWSMNEVV